MPRNYKPVLERLHRSLKARREKRGIYTLDIPFVSQLPYNGEGENVTGAEIYRNDCGPACVAMLLEALVPDSKMTPNLIHRMITKKDRYTSVWELQNVLQSFKVETTRTTGEIEEHIIAKHGIIALINYGELPAQPRSSFTGPHFVVVKGFTDEHILVLDSLEPEGVFHRPRKILKAVFDTARRKTEAPRLAIVTTDKIRSW